jgi:predicted PurR-regulated permease PerM
VTDELEVAGGEEKRRPVRKRKRRGLIKPRARTSTILLGILTTILVGWVLHVGAGILQPLVIAFLLASILQPVVRGLARWHIPPPATVIVLVVLFFLGAWRLGVVLKYGVQGFLNTPGAPSTPPEGIPETQTNLAMIVEGIVVKMQEASVPEPVIEFVKDSAGGQELREFATGLLGGGFDFTKGLMLVVIYMLFIFAEQAVFRRKITAIAGDNASEVLDTISRGIQRYLGVKTLISLLTGSIAYAVLEALGVRYAYLFAILTFLLNYIPTFGSIIAAIFPTITAFADPAGGSMNKAIIVIVVYLAINVTLGNFVEPKILGRELNLSPLVIIISVVVWAALWGPVGTFLAVPLTAGIQIVLANGKTTRPIAVMMSSGPPKEPKRPRGREAAVADEEEQAA